MVLTVNETERLEGAEEKYNGVQYINYFIYWFLQVQWFNVSLFSSIVSIIFIFPLNPTRATMSVEYQTMRSIKKCGSDRVWSTLRVLRSPFSWGGLNVPNDLNCFHICIFHFCTQKWNICCVPILVVLKQQISIVFMAVMTWCNWTKSDIYSLFIYYANQRPLKITRKITTYM